MVEEVRIVNYLQSHNIRPSKQRVRIMEYLLKHRNHPTVDMIYTDLHPQMPNLSKTTIYNTLKLFVEKQITLLISIEDNETRYDADTNLHAHFKCKMCEGVFDLPIEKEIFQFSNSQQFIIEEYHLYLKGICNVCNTRLKA